jgi:hypothetical protein
LVLWFGKRKSGETPLTILPETNAAPAAVATSSPPANAPVHTNAPSAQTTFSASPDTNQQQSSLPQGKIELLKGILEANDVDIVFYGRLADQFGDVVPNAVVKFGVRYYNVNGKGVRRGQVLSDANGLFTISGYKGQDISIVPEKSGYVPLSMPPGSGNYSYQYPESQRAHPDPNNPVVVKMWKLQGAEPLVGINKTFKLPYTGTPLFFDLLTGNVVPAGGDLEVIVTREPGVITQRMQDHRDWSIKLVPVNGGILETDYHAAQVTFAAPAEGYQDGYFVQMNHDDPAWYDNIYKTFFLTSRNGQTYSKFSLGFKVNDDSNGPMWFQFEGVASTNGSRNWEATVPQ